jgi:hypothetical protein
MSNRYAKKRCGTCMMENVPRKSTGITYRIIAAIRCIRLDRIIESGITDRGNMAFLMSDRSNTIEGVAFVSESEKKFQTRRPMKRYK